MTKAIVRAGADAFTKQSKPAKNFSGRPRIRLRQNDELGWLRLKTPAPRGATIVSAKLVLTQVDGFSGAVSITLRRVAAAWGQAKITANNAPGLTGHAAVTLSKVSPGNATKWTFDVTSHVQDWTNGQANNGWRLALTSLGAGLSVGSLDTAGASYRPYLEVVWSTAPEIPTVLKPSYGAVASPKPTVSCDFTDHSGNGSCVAVQVQIDNDGIFTPTPDWDSGQVNVPGIPQLDLSTTTFPGIAMNGHVKWRIRVMDDDGLWSGWSDAADLIYMPRPLVEIEAPADPPNDYVTEFTPPVSWQLTAGVQSHYRVLVNRADNPHTWMSYDTGKVVSTSQVHTIPKGILSDDVRYRVTVQVWDAVPREATPGAPVYAEDSKEFVVQYDPNVEPPDSLTAKQAKAAVGDSAMLPYVDLTWTRPTLPDSFTILRNGAAIDTDAVPGDGIELDPDGITYHFRDRAPLLETPSTYRVAAEVNGVLAQGGPSATITPGIEGVWLIDPSSGGKAVVISGRDVETFAEDIAQSYQVLGSSQVVRAIMGINGLSGTVNGSIRDRFRDPAFTWREMQKTLYRLKGRPTQVVRLAYGDIAIPVVLGDIKIAPHAETIRGHVLKSVSFKWWQVSEHPFQVM